MAFGHEHLDVYSLAIQYVKWVVEQSPRLAGVARLSRDQWLRASQSIPLNIAEGNGRTTPGDRRRFFEIARGSALECVAIQDVLVVGGWLPDHSSTARKGDLERIVAMLCKLGRRGFR